MKNLKKLSGILLAIAVLLACTVSAFAAETQGSGAAGTKGKITITNPAVGENYYVYKMFDLESYNATTGVYSYKVAAPWTEFVSGAGNQWFQKDEQNYVTLKTSITDNSDEAAKVAKAALEFIKTKNTTPGTISPVATLNTNTLSTGDIALGYYVVDSSLGTLCNLTTTNNEATINEKNTLPKLNKNIVGGTNNETETIVNIGETINYKIVIEAYKGAAGYKVVDYCDDGITLDVSNTTPPTIVDSLGTTFTKDYNYTFTVTDTPKGFEIEFKQDYLNTITGTSGSPTTITITYTGKVNEDGSTKTENAGNGNENKAKLMYNDNGDSETTPSVTHAYTYGFDLVKTNASKQLLAGAKFKIYASENGATPIKFSQLTNGKYYYDESGSLEEIEVKIKDASDNDINGKARFIGLKPGDYWVEETVAPNGYNLLAGRTKITITAAQDEYATLNAANTEWDSGGLQVVNKAGTILPSTGGIGTTIFYIVGGVLVAAAVVLLVAKKRTSENR